MSWLSVHKNQVKRTLVGFGAITVTVILASGVYLYRQKAATLAEIERNRQEREAEEAEASMAAAEERLEHFHFDSDVVEWNGKNYRRNTYVKAILCMGIDRSDEMTESKKLGEAGQADGVFLLAQDTARNSIQILSIPRDTITPITITDGTGTITGKELDHLSLAFSYGDGMQQSGRFMAEAVSDLFHGFSIDHYFAADMAVINDLNDAVGGITVTIPDFGMEKADPAFVPGEAITLQGKQAERFVRYRDIEEDQSAIYRMNRQKEYIIEYFQILKKKSRENSNIVEHLFSIMENYMVTDMAKGEYMKMVLDALNSDGIRSESFYLVPGNGITGAEYDEFYPDMEETIEVLLNLFYREVS